MKKYQYLASWDDQTLTRVGEPVVVLGDSNVSQVEVILPSNFLLDPTKAECRMYFLLPGEKESAHDVLETAVKDENGDSHVTWTIKHVHSQKGGRLAFSLTLIGDDAQWDSRTAIIPVYESRYQPESEEEEEPYTGRLTALEGSMAAIRGEFTEVQDDFEELKETATLGTPIPESLVANMQEGHVYIYTGTEPGYTAGHVYYYVGGALTDGGQYGGTSVDTTLTVSGAAADAKVTGDKIAEIKEDLKKKSGLTEDVKVAMLDCFKHVAWIDEHGQTYYDNLYNALYSESALVRLEAVFTQGSAVVYPSTPLNDLKAYLTVTGFYNDGTSGRVTDYALSGTLTVGTSTITVIAEGKTATFDVVVTEVYWDYEWNAGSGVLPDGMTATWYNFDSDNELHVQQPNMPIEYVGNYHMIAEFKVDPLARNRNNPQMQIRQKNNGDGTYSGVRMICNYGTNADLYIPGQTDGLITNDLNYHTVELYCDNDETYVKFDDHKYSGATSTSRYLEKTGIYSEIVAGNCDLYLKSIKLKQL